MPNASRCEVQRHLRPFVPAGIPNGRPRVSRRRPRRTRAALLLLANAACANRYVPPPPAPDPPPESNAYGAQFALLMAGGGLALGILIDMTTSAPWFPVLAR